MSIGSLLPEWAARLGPIETFNFLSGLFYDRVASQQTELFGLESLVQLF